MVTKTRRKRSAGVAAAATRVKTAKRRKRSKRSKRGRCRTAKRGGMMRSSRAAVAAASPLLRKGPQGPRVFQNIIIGREPHPKEGALVVNGMRYFGTPGDMPPPSFSDRFRKEFEDKTEDPNEILGAADSAFSAANKGVYNNDLRDKLKNQTPARPHKQPQFVTPQRNDFHPEQQPSPMYKLETPAGSSTERSSPPPLSVVGNAYPSYTDSREFKQSFAITNENPSPDKTIRRLEL